uniref:C2H2-type domain-containing protein n=1 Tax=Timema tahoe TaxID=61484 RepID=A0A7R9IIG3_9NEOP|nr:unnamed protein product [Timema tahoe]
MFPSVSIVICPCQMNQYDQPGTLLCNQCGAALPDFESFRTHLKSHLEEAGGLRGLLGGGGTDLLAMLAASSSEQRVKSPALPCPHCGAKFSSPEDHQQHLASHFLATATEYGCQSCLKLFSKPDELQKHLMDIHAHHLYRCSLCKEMFDSKVAIQVHFAVKHSNECKLYRCTACPLSSAVFRSEMDFGLHVRTIHHHPPPPLPLSPTKLPASASQQQFRCLFCRLSFPTEHDMQFHLTVHSKQFHCPFCQEGFHVEFLLDKHMQTHHTTQVLSSSSSNGVDNPSQQKSPKSKPSSGGNPSNSMVTIGNNNSSLNINNNNSSRGSSSDNGVASKIPESAKNCCDICDRRDFASESELTAHRKLVHHVKTAGAGGGKNGAVSLHCAYCSENCKSRTELENHMKTHSQGSGGSGKHKCNICDELCPSAAILAEHKLTHCKVVSGSVCTQCKSNLVSEEQFYSHLQQHGGGGANNSTNSPQQVALPTPCVVCRQTLISDIEVRMHARFHLKNSEPTYQCFLCLKQFESQNLVVANGGHQAATYVCKECYHCHSKTSPSPSQEQAFRCPECQVKFETSSALEAHLVTVHKKTYQCIKCQISFETEREIQLHVATHLLTEGSSHECHLCRRLLSTPLKLQAHLIEHTFAGCGSYTCYLCSAVFTASQGLQQHMLEHGLAARPYDCSRCSLRFFFRAELDNHSYSHLEEAMVGGSGALIDGGDLATKAAFYHHLTTNGSYDPSPDLQYYKTLSQDPVQQKPHRPKGGKLGPKGGTFRCSECGKEFSSALGLQAHQRHHNKHSRRSCVECGKEFSSARNLGVHMRAHHPGEHSSDDRTTSDERLDGVKQERGHPCTVCQKEFSDADLLEVHVLSQHSRCPHCGEAFLHQTLCVQHIAHAHPESVAIKQEPAVIKQEDEEDLDVASLSAPTAVEEHYGPGLDEAPVDVVGDTSPFDEDTRKDDSSTNQSEVNNSVTSCEDSDDVDKRQ